MTDSHDEGIGGSGSASGEPPLARVRWRRSWRLVPARFPPVPLFERVTDPADLEVTLAIEALTDPGMRDAVGDLAAVPPSGPVGYPRSAAFAGRLRDAGSAGIVYDSVRRTHGQCAALFRPRAMKLPVIEHAVVRLVWDGDRQAIVDVFETRTLPDT